MFKLNLKKPKVTDSQEKNVKQNRTRVERVRPKKIMLIILWSLFAVSFIFAVYKNFTAIDIHTVHEIEVVKQEIVDTSRIESFVKGFATNFYAWVNDADSIKNRKSELEKYMTDDLLKLNSGTAGTNKDVSSSVTDIKIWELKKLDDFNYKVTYSVYQKIARLIMVTEMEYVEEPEIVEVVDPKTGKVSYKDEIVQKEIEKQIESIEESYAESYYTVIVHLDEDGGMVITRNPTISSMPGKSDYTPKAATSDGNVGSVVSEEITTFLEKFFKLYPTADEIELAYYVKDNALPVIGKAYEFKELISTSFEKEDEAIKVHVTVKYNDELTGVDQFSQFVLKLEKDGNWFIVNTEN